MNETMLADIPGRGVDALKQLRAMTADICDVVPLTAEDDFHVTTVTMMTRNALLVDTRATDQEYDRTPAHVARGAMDHFQITLCVEGEMRFSSGRREVTMGPGAICLIDMAQPNRTVLRGGGSRTRLMAIILQRAMLAPRLAHPDSATATLLPSNHPHTRLLASHYAALTLPPEPEPGSAEATIEAIADIVAAAAGGTADIAAGVERAERHLYLAMIKRRIADNLETDALTADELCRHFQISRATLYRLFEADGGLSHYVREQRLNLAFRQLISPSAEDTRLIDLAVGMRFSSDSTFIRAFRRKFGLTPGELRELADNWLRETGAVPTIDTVLHQLARRRTS
ncbi:helix-turn-helix domain-containing protein [Bradyrhizobium japonicum]|uniref:helix-turn-helix domain-containing protein n=1 Tax=Bradyrhizobium japonicum TaxID=375 RepID=UPI000456BFE3|nr:helix-turn-helix domain-containing protein [Bradyrhizobium japonicum]AHY54916.1 transcriptional regulatory protein [Bradyrhizobium japonicum SEMIA 5079]MBR0915492.1 helix-turn-helix domain-containing protein [Bradyrhizobium japonicum]MCD9111164.1 helix-turn-helix domain-containing protein [Bradyrhizobium japonicum]MCD9257331.1 helix-turn-helix domain-containing protein [Bradyrhizobium japonicum SEMIA 5079]MCD9824259.1 helix-turn-helix domain-containing protein [Bradyrhizobium japonicum]